MRNNGKKRDVYKRQEYEDDKYLFMATRNGIVKKTPIKDYENIRKNGLAAINLREDDKLIEMSPELTIFALSVQMP